MIQESGTVSDTSGTLVHVFECVEERAEEAVALVEVLLVAVRARASSRLDALADALPNEARRGVPSSLLVGDVILRRKDNV